MENASVEKLPFLPRLEALRGLAAVAVVGYHAVNDETVTGMAPVVMFFVLSGFVLARSLSNDDSPLRFFQNRILRLLPAAAASVLLLSFLHWQWGFYVGVPRSFELSNIGLNALMLRSDINGPMWSLTVECFAAPLILGSFFAYSKFGRCPLVLLCAALFGLSFWGDYVHLLGGVTNLAPLYAFVIGVCLHFFDHGRLADAGPWRANTCGHFAFSGLRTQKANRSHYPRGNHRIGRFDFLDCKYRNALFDVCGA